MQFDAWAKNSCGETVQTCCNGCFWLCATCKQKLNIIVQVCNIGIFCVYWFCAHLLCPNNLLSCFKDLAGKGGRFWLFFGPPHDPQRHAHRNGTTGSFGVLVSFFSKGQTIVGQVTTFFRKKKGWIESWICGFWQHFCSTYEDTTKEFHVMSNPSVLPPLQRTQLVIFFWHIEMISKHVILNSKGCQAGHDSKTVACPTICALGLVFLGIKC